MGGQYVGSTKSSAELFERAQGSIPAGVNNAVRYMKPHPLFVARASGSKVYDADGNEYLDFWMGHGALVLGHAFPPVVEAMRQQAEGAHFGYNSEWEVLLAEKVVELVPSAEQVRFCNSGTEANMYAMRLARGYTGRAKIIKYEGGWHGGYDALHTGVFMPMGIAETAGLTDGAMEDTSVLPFNDLEASVAAIGQGDVAAVLVETVQGAGGVVAAEPAFLQGLRDACTANGTLLVFDEVITAFRLAPGGGQEVYDVIPDLTVLGKLVGGGFLPAGAICGRADVMELNDHLIHTDRTERVYHGGTYSGNPLVCCAGYTALSELDENRETIYPRLNSLGERVRNGLQERLRNVGLSAYATGLGSMAAVHITPVQPRDARTAYHPESREDILAQLSEFLLDSRVLYRGFHPHFFLSTAHTDDDTDRLLSLVEEFARSL